MPQTKNIQVTVANSEGQVSADATFQVTDVVGPPVIQSVTVDPPSGPPGTIVTVTVLADGAAPLTYSGTVDGQPMQPSAGGPNIFLFTA